MKLNKLLLLLLFTVNNCLSAQNVTFDNSFGNNGIVSTPNTVEITLMDTDSDGKIITAGYYYSNKNMLEYHLALARYNKDGSLDTSFGTNGVVQTNIEKSDMPYSLLIQPDGKIIVCCCYTQVEEWIDDDGTLHAFFYSLSYIARFSNDGSLDPEFGDNGVVRIKNYDNFEKFATLTMGFLPGDKILIGGNSTTDFATFTVLNSDGSLDTQFGNNGKLTLNDPNFNFIIWRLIIVDKSIICVGNGYTYNTSGYTNNPELAAIKLNLDGSFDKTFADDGKLIIDLDFPFIKSFTDIKITNDNHFLVSGFADSQLMVKFDFNGNLDEKFGLNGIAAHDYPSADFAIQKDGKIIIVGSDLISAYNYGFSVCRLQNNGIPDLSFCENESFVFDISPENDHPQCLKIQEDDGKLLIGGSAGSNGDAEFTLVRLNIADNAPSGIAEQKRSNIIISPNPVKDELYFDSDEIEISNIQIYDSTGRLIEKTDVISNNFRLKANHWSKGIYLCVIKTIDGKVHSKKIIKE